MHTPEAHGDAERVRRFAAAPEPLLSQAFVQKVLVERAGVAAAGRAYFAWRSGYRDLRVYKSQFTARSRRTVASTSRHRGDACSMAWRYRFLTARRSWPALVGFCADRGRVAGRRLVVSEGVRGRGGDREEEAYSASRHLRRTQSGPAAGAGSRGETRPTRAKRRPG